MSVNQPFHLLWQGIPFTLHECELVCALSLYVQFEDGTPLDDSTIGQVIGACSGLQNMNCIGLVDHLRLTKNVYPQILSDGNVWYHCARTAYNKWLDRHAAPIGFWP